MNVVVVVVVCREARARMVRQWCRYEVGVVEAAIRVMATHCVTLRAVMVVYTVHARILAVVTVVSCGCKHDQ